MKLTNDDDVDPFSTIRTVSTGISTEAYVFVATASTKIIAPQRSPNPLKIDGKKEAENYISMKLLISKNALITLP